MRTTDTRKFGLVLDESQFYWLEGIGTASATVQSCPLSGCTTSNALTPPGVYDFVLDRGFLYWSDAVPGANDSLTGLNIHRSATERGL